MPIKREIGPFEGLEEESRKEDESESEEHVEPKGGRGDEEKEGPINFSHLECVEDDRSVGDDEDEEDTNASPHENMCEAIPMREM